MAENLANLPELEFEKLVEDIDLHDSLRDVLAWAAAMPSEYVHPQIVAEVVTQDEFTHDVVIPYQHLFLVYDTT